MVNTAAHAKLTPVLHLTDKGLFAPRGFAQHLEGMNSYEGVRGIVVVGFVIM